MSTGEPKNRNCDNCSKNDPELLTIAYMDGMYKGDKKSQNKVNKLEELVTTLREAWRKCEDLYCYPSDHPVPLVYVEMRDKVFKLEEELEEM